MNAAVVGNGACKHQRPSRSPLIGSQGRWAVLKTNLQDSLDWRLGEWGRRGANCLSQAKARKTSAGRKLQTSCTGQAVTFPTSTPGGGGHLGLILVVSHPPRSPSGRLEAPLRCAAGPDSGGPHRRGTRSALEMGSLAAAGQSVCMGWGGGEREGQLPGLRLPFYLGYESWDRMERFGTLGERRSEKKKKESGRSAGWSRAGRGGRGEARPGQGINAVSGAAGARAESCCLASPPGPPPRVSGT